ncbi:hypothetical protein B0H14DRAFT_3646427 [Mycena olivaceomarginata]|nr:hypothetical protein B0H14DRAFT_3646427 [Mycena olivaceomarginata]
MTNPSAAKKRKKRREQKLLEEERQRLETETARVSMLSPLPVPLAPLPPSASPHRAHSPLQEFPHPSQWPADVRAFVYGPPSPDEDGNLPVWYTDEQELPTIPIASVGITPEPPLVSWDDDVANTFPDPAFLRPHDWPTLRSDAPHPWRTIRRRKRRTRPHWRSAQVWYEPVPLPPPPLPLEDRPHDLSLRPADLLGLVSLHPDGPIHPDNVPLEH